MMLSQGTTAAVLVAATVFGVAGCSSTTSPPPPTSPSPTSSAPSASASASAGALPADVPVPTGLKEIGLPHEDRRTYYGKGTLDAVSAQMIEGFTDAGYEIQEGGKVSEDGVTMGFTKGSSRVLMIVTGEGKNVACVVQVRTP